MESVKVLYVPSWGWLSWDKGVKVVSNSGTVKV